MNLDMKPIFIGGDTTDLTYDFYLKTLGSMICPLRAFTSDVDINALPAPVDGSGNILSVWKEFSQSQYDKIKSQNFTGLVEVANNSANANIVSLNNSVENGALSVNVEGNTLKNEVVNGNFANGTTGFTPIVSTISATNNTLSITGNGSNATPYAYKAYSNNVGNKYYVTIYARVTNSACTKMTVEDSGGNRIIINSPIQNTFYRISGIFSASSTQILFAHYYADSTTANGKVMEVQNVMALNLTSLGLESKTVAELDALTNQYFEGIKSVSLKSVMSVGKNLLSEPKAQLDFDYIYSGMASTTYDGTVLTLTGGANQFGRAGKKLKVKPNTNYRVSIDGYRDTTAYGNVDIFASNSVLITGLALPTTRGMSYFTFNSGNNTEVSFLYYPTANSVQASMYIYSAQIEEGTTQTTYEAYKSNSKTITPNIELCSLPSGVKDVVSSGGVVTRKIKKVVLNGSESWNYESESHGYYITLSDKKPSTLFMTDKYTYTTDNLIPLKMCRYGSGGNILFNYDDGAIGVSAFKTYLASNPITVYYELATPTTEQLNTSLDLVAYSKGTLIVDTGEIVPYLKEWHTTDSADDGVYTTTSSTTGLSKAILLEVDMTPVCNAIAGGVNATLKALFKSFNVSSWASASGNNGGIIGNNAILKAYYPITPSWISWGQNTNSNISSIDVTQNTTGYKDYITTQNKVYFLVHSLYPSSDTIPSTLNFDYFSAKVSLTRIVDNITPLDITLPNEWSIVLKGISLSVFKNPQYLFSLGETSNKLSVRFDSLGKSILLRFNNVDVANPSLNSTTINNSLYNTINFVLTKNASNLFTINLFNNNGTSIFKSSVTISNFDLNNVSTKLTLGDFFLNGSGSSLYKLGGFSGMISLIPKALNDNEISCILKGRNEIDGANAHYNYLANKYANPNLLPLFSDSKWTKHANATVSTDGKTLTLNATASWQANYIDIPVLPNNRYELKGNIVASSGYGAIYATEYYNNTLLRQFSGEIDATGTNTFITLSNTNKIRIFVVGSTTGTYTFSNITLTRKD